MNDDTSSSSHSSEEEPPSLADELCDLQAAYWTDRNSLTPEEAFRRDVDNHYRDLIRSAKYCARIGQSESYRYHVGINRELAQALFECAKQDGLHAIIYTRGVMADRVGDRVRQPTYSIVVRWTEPDGRASSSASSNRVALTASRDDSSGGENGDESRGRSVVAVPKWQGRDRERERERSSPPPPRSRPTTRSQRDRLLDAK